MSMSWCLSMSMSASMFDERLTTAAMDRSIQLRLLLLQLDSLSSRDCANLRKFEFEIFIYLHTHTRTLARSHTHTLAACVCGRFGASVKSEKLRAKWINLLFKQMKCQQNDHPNPLSIPLQYHLPSLPGLRTFTIFPMQNYR